MRKYRVSVSLEVRQILEVDASSDTGAKQVAMQAVVKSVPRGFDIYDGSFDCNIFDSWEAE